MVCDRWAWARSIGFWLGSVRFGRFCERVVSAISRIILPIWRTEQYNDVDTNGTIQCWTNNKPHTHIPSRRTKDFGDLLSICFDSCVYDILLYIMDDSKLS